MNLYRLHYVLIAVTFRAAFDFNRQEGDVKAQITADPSSPAAPHSYPIGPPTDVTPQPTHDGNPARLTTVGSSHSLPFSSPDGQGQPGDSPPVPSLGTPAPPSGYGSPGQPAGIPSGSIVGTPGPPSGYSPPGQSGAFGPPSGYGPPGQLDTVGPPSGIPSGSIVGTPGPPSGYGPPGQSGAVGPPSGYGPPSIQPPLPPGTLTTDPPWSGGESSTTGPRPPLLSFLKRLIYKDCRPNMAPTDDTIPLSWEEQLGELEGNIANRIERYSCEDSCGASERSASSPLSEYSRRCYCDDLCDSFGDCCYDFHELCKQGSSPPTLETSNETCVAFEDTRRKAKYHGYAAWSRCHSNWTDENMRKKCQEASQDDLLRNLPVFDSYSRVTYKNIFCATCNGAKNTVYWKLEVVCRQANITTLNFTTIFDLVQNSNCFLKKYPATYQLFYLKRCIPRFSDCSSVAPTENKTLCQEQCLAHAVPVCYQVNREIYLFRNPQCAVCNGFKVILESNCIAGTAPVSPPLTVLLDFQSTSQYQVDFKDNNGHTFKLLNKRQSCLSDEVYDPYVDQCKKIASKSFHNEHQTTNSSGTGGNQRNQTELKPNCTFLAFSKSEFQSFSNGSVFLKPHRKMYPKTVFQLTEDGLLLCVNFTRNFTKKEKENQSTKITSTRGSLQLLTSIGGIISFISLILLLVTYILFAELRNLPGKIVINLSSGLLLYQLIFFLAVDTSDKVRCLVIAVLLHFFALSSFMWMNVMAFDIHRTFTASGAVGATQDDPAKRLVKYAVYAIGTPVVIVLTTLVVDHVTHGSVGYGQEETECFISNLQAKLYSFVLPVGILMLFNIAALGHTLYSIIQTRMRVQQVTNQRPSSSITWICVKMVSMMGVTWLLGVAANFRPLWFLWYPYVVLNSLQGFFIFLSFASSGRALELYKGKFRKVLQIWKKPTDTTAVSENGQGTNPTEESLETRF